jgi:hypothetical protein
MANMTLSIPNEIHDKMKEFPEIKWSQIARNAILEKVEKMDKLQKIEEIVKKSKLTQKDADEISLLIKKSAAKRFREL